MKSFVALTLAAAAVANQQPDSADDFEYLTGLEVPEADIDMSVTEATIYYDNADAMPAMDEFDAESFSLSGFTLEGLMNTFGDDEHTANLATAVREGFMAYYTQQAAKLPEVCDSGKRCRAEIKEAVKGDVSETW